MQLVEIKICHCLLTLTSVKAFMTFSTVEHKRNYFSGCQRCSFPFSENERGLCCPTMEKKIVTTTLSKLMKKLQNGIWYLF